jgi:PIN like domain
VASLTFYFDRCFGKRFPEALAHAGIPQKVEYQHGKSNNFSQSMPDDAWLEICGKNGWIVFSHDQKFHSITTEATAIKQHKVGCFYLPGAN